MSEGKTREVLERTLAILDELPAIGKDQRNEQQKFMYRSHDDVLNALNPLLAKHGVFMAPQVLDRVAATRATKSGGVMYEVNLHVQYTFWGPDGSCFYASAWGEGTDSGDKATNKAMTMAFKNVIAQVFAVSTQEGQRLDTDGNTDEPTVVPEAPFDPGKRLLPGAPSGPEVLRLIGEMQTHVDPSLDWQPIGAQLREQRYGVAEWSKLADDQKRDFVTRYANALTRLTDQMTGDFPPLGVDAIQEAIAWAFEGYVVEVPVAAPALPPETPPAAPAAPESDADASAEPDPTESEQQAAEAGAGPGAYGRD